MLPGDWVIENRDIKKFHDGEIFTVMNPDGENIELEPFEDFGSYYEMWENYHYFGLPHGKGWIDELPWVINFLKYFNKIHNDIEIYRIKKGR